MPIQVLKRVMDSRITKWTKKMIDIHNLPSKYLVIFGSTMKLDSHATTEQDDEAILN